MEKLRFSFEATGIGSVPFNDPKAACRLILENFPAIPFWPQLPRRSFYENMYAQYSEGMPGIVIDELSKTIRFDTAKVAEELETAFGKYVENDVDYFAISEKSAAGLYEFIGSIKAAGRAGSGVAKGHITGPISFALSMTDENKRSVIYDKDLFDVVTKVLAMKARWQVRLLKEIAPDVIIFMDEPYLISIGSSYVNIDARLAAEKIDEVSAAIRQEGALSGLHCCGNTDWSLLLKREIDILNFDAYNFAKEFSLYADDIKSFVGRGSTIAWGIVPSSDAIDKETVKMLGDRMKTALKFLADKGVDMNGVSSLITSSCGLGSLDESRAKRIMGVVKQVSETMKAG